MRATRIWLLLSALSFFVLGASFAYVTAAIIATLPAYDPAWPIPAGGFALATLCLAGTGAVTLNAWFRIRRFVSDGGFARFREAVAAHDLTWRIAGLAAGLLGVMFALLTAIAILGTITMLTRVERAAPPAIREAAREHLDVSRPCSPIGGTNANVPRSPPPRVRQNLASIVIDVLSAIAITK